MSDSAPSHSDQGLLRVLTLPWVYATLRFVLLKQRAGRRFMEFVGPFPGCRVLDIGCGPADVLSYLPTTIGAYEGFDMNAAYIDFARKRWRARPNCRFHRATVRGATVPAPGSFDIVLAQSVVHHLDDDEARHLFRTAYSALRDGGRLMTYDCVYTDDQHPVARWLIARDRGNAVRTIEGYERIARSTFRDIEGVLLHDTLRVPYTIYAMKCEKRPIVDTRDADQGAEP